MLTQATEEDAEGVAALRTAAALDLMARYGKGHWCSPFSVRAALLSMKRGRVYVAKNGNVISATLTLSHWKPWAIDRRYFTPCQKPLYLTGMAVDPSMQHRGVGRSCIEEVVELARAWPGDSICLDAYDAPAGAGGFYAACGFREVGRVVYRRVPVIYFELILKSLR
jgi:GNAT superfamily N-acetyltransferase